jgi:hypothetical protein
VKIATRAIFFGTITNSATGETFLDHASFTETVNIPRTPRRSTGSATTTSSGDRVRSSRRGHKISITATGEVIFQGGQDDLAGEQDPISLCTSLA